MYHLFSEFHYETSIKHFIHQNIVLFTPDKKLHHFQAVFQEKNHATGFEKQLNIRSLEKFLQSSSYVLPNSS